MKASSVLVVGIGGLGCPCALYLAAAGIGNNIIIAILSLLFIYFRKIRISRL